MVNPETKICVVGGFGFVGSNIANTLASMGYPVTVVDDLSFGFMDNLKDYGTTKYCQDFDNSTITWNDYDVMIFSACVNIIAAMDQPIHTFNTNSVKALKLFNGYNGKIINLSTASVYGDPDIVPTPETAKIKLTNPYDCSKYIVELYLKKRGNYTNFRLSNVFGINQRSESPYCGVLGKMIHSAINDLPIEIYGTGEATRDFNYVFNVVDAVTRAIERPAMNMDINIASGEEISVIDLGNKVWDAVGRKPKYLHTELRKIDNINRRCLDISMAKKLLDWTPRISLDEGIQLTVKWMEKKMAKVTSPL